MAQPVRRFKAGGCIASVFTKELTPPPELVVAYSVALQRVYKASDGSFQYTTSFGTNDLPKAILVLRQAYEYLVTDDRGERS